MCPHWYLIIINISHIKSNIISQNNVEPLTNSSLQNSQRAGLQIHLLIFARRTWVTESKHIIVCPVQMCMILCSDLMILCYEYNSSIPNSAWHQQNEGTKFLQNSCENTPIQTGPKMWVVVVKVGSWCLPGLCVFGTEEMDEIKKEFAKDTSGEDHDTTSPKQEGNPPLWLRIFLLYVHES